MTDEADHYILDTRQVVGNCAYWWRPNGQGYTCDLMQAGLFTQRYATEQHARRCTDVPVPRDVAQAATVTHVRIERLRDDPRLSEALRAADQKRLDETEQANALSEDELQDMLEVNPFDGDFGPSGLQTLRDSIVTARKEHTCHDCRCTIRKGCRHRCRVECSDEDAGVQVYRWCHDCMRVHAGYPYGARESAQR